EPPKAIQRVLITSSARRACQGLALRALDVNGASGNACGSSATLYCIAMLALAPTPLIRLGNLFPQRAVHAKCEFLAPSGCFKIRGARHLLDSLTREGQTRHLVVPSMGNTALGAATAAQALGFTMTGLVPPTLSQS